MTKVYSIAKFGMYKRPSAANASPQAPRKAGRFNAYLALVTYMQRQENSLKR